MSDLDLERLGAGRIELNQQISRDSTMLVQARVKIACVSTETFKPVRIPDSIRNKIQD